MKIEIWSDVTCPFCYIGKREMETALKGLAFEADIEISWKSFELNPHATLIYDGSVYDYLGKKYRKTREEVLEMTTPIIQRGQTLGLNFQFDQVQPANSFDAHRVLKLAKQQGLDQAVKERLFHAYFSEGKIISDIDSLLELGLEVGLEKESLESVLHSDAFADEVRQDELEAQQLGIRGVPFFLFDQKYALSGAHPAKTFKEVLERVWQDEYAPTQP